MSSGFFRKVLGRRISIGQIAVVALILTATSPLFSQTGRVRVRVTDPLGARIFDTEVRFLDQNKKVVQISRSDRLGEAILTNLPIGEGSVDINVPGLKRTIFVGVKTEGEKEVVIDAKLQQGKMSINYDGPGPLPTKRVRIRVRDSAGSPISTAHGWIVSDGDDPVVLADMSGELLFKVVPIYPGICITGDGFSSQLVAMPDSKSDEVHLDVTLK